MNSIVNWIGERRMVSGLTVEQVSLNETAHWLNTDGSIKHESGSFFSIVGISAIKKDNNKIFLNQPIIDQPEVGILGFLFCSSKDGLKILLQAKTEPGNIGGTQIAPTVQATYSNYMQVHKGKPTRFIAHFLSDNKLDETGTLQSEQGSRFLSKYNRNISIFLNSERELCERLGSAWHWFPLKSLLSLVDEDYLINTDSRSVLVCSNWNKLADGSEPFGHHTDEFGYKLYHSYKSLDSKANFLELLNQSRYSKQFRLQSTSLEDLDGWTYNGHSIFSNDSFAVNSYRISVMDREVSEWSQPLVQSQHLGSVVLFCQVINNVLHFLISSSIEIGFSECVQFGPSVNILDQGMLYDNIDVDDNKTKIIAEYLQSDEGGRFYHSTVHYCLKEIREGEVLSIPEDFHWMTLGDIHNLLPIKGVFTNELRSVLSLTLKYL